MVVFFDNTRSINFSRISYDIIQYFFLEKLKLELSYSSEETSYSLGETSKNISSPVAVDSSIVPSSSTSSSSEFI